jgi:hypothetical protein
MALDVLESVGLLLSTIDSIFIKPQRAGPWSASSCYLQRSVEELSRTLASHLDEQHFRH